jgi:hypothetical protein
VSNADATRYLKEWVEEKQAAGGQVAATPAAVLEQAARLAGACWAEASAVATERPAAAEAVWAQEKKDLGLEIAELVAEGAAGAGTCSRTAGQQHRSRRSYPAGRGRGPGRDPATGARRAPAAHRAGNPGQG